MNKAVTPSMNNNEALLMNKSAVLIYKACESAVPTYGGSADPSDSYSSAATPVCRQTARGEYNDTPRQQCEIEHDKT